MFDTSPRNAVIVGKGGFLDFFWCFTFVEKDKLFFLSCFYFTSFVKKDICYPCVTWRMWTLYCTPSLKVLVMVEMKDVIVLLLLVQLLFRQIIVYVLHANLLSGTSNFHHCKLDHEGCPSVWSVENKKSLDDGGKDKMIEVYCAKFLSMWLALRLTFTMKAACSLMYKQQEESGWSRPR